MLRPFPQYSGVTDVYGNVAQLELPLAAAHGGAAAGDDGLTVNVNYTFSRTEDDLAARTGYDFEQDWAVGVNDQPHVFNAIVVYDLPFGARGKPGSGNAVVRALVGGWQVSGITQFRSGRPLGSIVAACNLPNAGNCYADFNPAFSGPVRINGDYGDGDVLGADPADLHRSQRVRVAAGVHLRQHAAHAGVRPAQPELLQPGPEHPPRLPAARGLKLGLGVEVFNLFNTVVFGGINTNITNANFGRVSSQTNTPRVAQLKVASSSRQDVLMYGRHGCVWLPRSSPCDGGSSRGGALQRRRRSGTAGAATEATRRRRLTTTRRCGR